MACVQGQQTGQAGQQAAKQEEQAKTTADTDTKYYRHACPVSSVCRWRLRCWTKGASSLKLDAVSALAYQSYYCHICHMGALHSMFADRPWF